MTTQKQTQGTEEPVQDAYSMARTTYETKFRPVEISPCARPARMKHEEALFFTVFLSTDVMTAYNILEHPVMGPAIKQRILRNSEYEVGNLVQEHLPKTAFDAVDLNDLVPYRINLRGADLSRANLRGATLEGADLSRANIYGSDLRGADLSRANLRGAIFPMANFAGATLEGADLSGADMSFADLSFADLSFAAFDDANIEGANFYGAYSRYDPNSIRSREAYDSKK